MLRYLISHKSISRKAKKLHEVFSFCTGTIKSLNNYMFTEHIMREQLHVHWSFVNTCMLEPHSDDDLEAYASRQTPN